MDYYKLFISHYSKERPVAEAAKYVLTEAYAGHAEVFISSDVPRGLDWLAHIKKRLTESDEVLTIFTHKSVDRPWLNIETGYGIMSGKVVTPLLCRGFQLTDLPIQYRIRQAVNCHNECEVLEFYNDVFSRIRGKSPRVTSWDQPRFWDQWNQRIQQALQKIPLIPPRTAKRPVVWVLGSHRHLQEIAQQQTALQVCRVLARTCLENQIRLVLGTSRMLEYLADKYVNYMEDPEVLAAAPGEEFRKAIATEQAQTSKPAPNPVVVLGTLRSRSVREVFADAIGRIPDMAILIGGRVPEESGRASQEAELAIDAGIPLLPLKFTGGAAALLEDTLDPSLRDKVNELQTLVANVDRFGPLILEIIEEQVAISRDTPTHTRETT